MWRTSRQVYLLCRWEKHLAGFPHLGVVDRWLATSKQGWTLKPKPENPVLKEILETETETDTYLAKIL